MKQTREQIQTEALKTLKENNYHGTICLSTGTGKSKIAIDAIKEGNFKNVLITSPRTNLKENWNKELDKWGQGWLLGDTYIVVIENIQTCYKWSLEQIQQFDYIIADEIHTLITPEYGKLINLAKSLNIPVTGLTATPDNHKPDKDLFYKTYCPIIYEYYDSAKDGIVNKRKYIIFEYNLSDAYKVSVGTKKKSWLVGEKTQYDYLTEQIKKGQVLMSQTGSQDWFVDASNWFWNKQGNPTQRHAAMIYLNAIRYRKNFLWNLTSSADIAVKLKNEILKTPSNKVLLFSELTTQANKLSPYTIHSHNDETANKQTLFAFDTGKIRELASCNSLTLGLNIKGANYAIMESFSGSTTGLQQKSGRLDRLDIDEFATIIFIIPQNTQAGEWFIRAVENLDCFEPQYFDSFDKEMFNT